MVFHIFDFFVNRNIGFSLQKAYNGTKDFMDLLDFLKIAPSSPRSYSSTSGRIQVSPKVSESLSHVLSRDMRFYGVPANFSTRFESMNLITEPKSMCTDPVLSQNDA